MINRRGLIATAGASAALAGTGLNIPQSAQVMEQAIHPPVTSPEAPRTNDGMGMFGLILALALLVREKYANMKNTADLGQVANNCSFRDVSNIAQSTALSLNAEQWDAEISKLIELTGATISVTDARNIANAFFAKLIASDGSVHSGS